ncbi:MAG: beta-galactosidase, partial [Planctomycetes bacterium]|nr:beta-galactosidase [Planctomycetota bacterium]
MNIRPEYPRPQMKRDQWLCLNGEWSFQRDYGDSGLQQGFLQKKFDEKIMVPFCPESELSGIGNVDFYNAVWYRKNVNVPADWAGQRILLHFQAVDYDSTVWVNQQQVALHRGGACGFTADISRWAQAGDEIEIIVHARDDHKKSQPKGKQSSDFHNAGCNYTRTTGIWQTVWLEPVPQSYLLRPRITPQLENNLFCIEQSCVATHGGMYVRATCMDNGNTITSTEHRIGHDFTSTLYLHLPEDTLTLWSCENPHLYDICIELLDAEKNVIDTVESYAGMRSVAIDGKKVLINGLPVFQRLVLDQGYYKDGILTAPNEESLIEDIQISMDAGFNGARLHQKVFEERFLYHADRMGYLVWGEFCDWAGNWHHRADTDWSATNITQWLEIIERDYNHPAIVGWCPLNESHAYQHD